MLVNEVPWTEASNGTRPLAAVNLPNLVDHSGVTYKRLQFSSLSAYAGITWGGQRWDNYYGIPTGPEVFDRLSLDGTIRMNASRTQHSFHAFNTIH